MPHGSGEPSDWVQRWAPLIRPGGSVLDVACGSGRHLRFLAARRHPVTGIDRDADALAPLQPMQRLQPPCRLIVADIEAGPWPLPDERFDAVVVTNYLWRPLLLTLLDALAPGGLLIYETFTAGNETVGKPSRTDFLLRPGELLQACATLRTVAYEDGFIDVPPRFVQRIAAVRPDPAAPAPARYPL